MQVCFPDSTSAKALSGSRSAGGTGNIWCIPTLRVLFWCMSLQSLQTHMNEAPITKFNLPLENPLSWFTLQRTDSSLKEPRSRSSGVATSSSNHLTFLYHASALLSEPWQTIISLSATPRTRKRTSRGCKTFASFVDFKSNVCVHAFGVACRVWCCRLFVVVSVARVRLW